MARVSKLEADLMARIHNSDQITGVDEALLVHVCEGKGWVRRDMHGCLYLTHDGECALAKYQRAIRAGKE